MSCSTEDIRGAKDLSGITVKLKSTAGELDKVYLEFEDVQLRVKEDEDAPNAWISLNAINTGTYNIFDLRHNSELLLVDNFELKSTYIYEMRLVLGDNNYIDIENTLFSFDVTDIGNAMPSNLVKLELEPNHLYDFIIDINIDNSVSFDENQDYIILDPEIYTEIRKY